MKTAMNKFLNIEAFQSRFFVLFLITLSWFGFYYCFDLPSVIRLKIVQMFEGQNPEEAEYYFDLMYSLYSFPNIFLPILSGLLIDRIGTNIIEIHLFVQGYNIPLLLFCGLVCIGNGIVFLGATFESISAILFGRFIFGVGGESLTIGVSAFLVSWFKEKELAFSQALSLSIGRVASVLNCFISPHASKYGVSAAYGVGVWICLMSLAAAILGSLIDRSRKANMALSNLPSSQEMLAPNKSFRKIVKQLFKCKAIFWFHVAAICMFYLSYLPFSMVASGYIAEKWYDDPNITPTEKVEKTGSLLGVPLIVSSLLFPVFGIIIDKYGKRLHFLFGAAFLLIFSYILFLLTTSMLPLLTLGLAYAIFGANVWTILAFLVPARVLGTAFGLVTILQNFTMTIFPLFIAYLSSTYSSNTQGMVTLMLNSFVALGLVGVVYRLDAKNKVSLASTDQTGILMAVEEEYSGKHIEEENEPTFSYEEEMPLV